MIATDTLRALVPQFHVLGHLDAAQIDLIAGELSPSEQLVAAEAMSVGGEAGVVLATTMRLLAVYSKLLLKRFPTIQSFDLPHVRRLEVRGSQVYIYGSPHSGPRGSEFEENTFEFRSPEIAAAVAWHLRQVCPQVPSAG